VIALRQGISWAGIVSGPFSWMLSTQANYAFASWPCANETRMVAWAALALALLAIAGGVISWRALDRNVASPGTSPRKPRSENLAALLGVTLAALFALVIGVHGLAGLVFTGCEQ
jgi:hypothetical protein